MWGIFRYEPLPVGYRLTLLSANLLKNNLRGPGSDSLNSNSICKVLDREPTSYNETCLAKYLPLMEKGSNYEGLIEFEPQYPLYSDGATKRRWIFLPYKTKINSEDPDNWKFPKGTITFKQFFMDGKLIETRQMEKIGAGDGFSSWRYTAYANLADGSNGFPTTDSFNEQPDSEHQKFAAYEFKDRYVVGTPNTCLSCHGSAADMVRGFNYLQLSNSSIFFPLSMASKLGILSNPPVKFDEIPGGFLDKAVIGYLQSNCATCHDGVGGGSGNFRHFSGNQVLADENLIKSARITPGLIRSGDPNSSLLYIRFDSGAMPPVNHKSVNEQMVDIMYQWIVQYPKP